LIIRFKLFTSYHYTFNNIEFFFFKIEKTPLVKNQGNIKPRKGENKPKSKKPQELNISQFVTIKLEEEKSKPQVLPNNPYSLSFQQQVKVNKSQTDEKPNPLDSTAPSERRRKEREEPKKKKPSKIKSKILEERSVNQKIMEEYSANAFPKKSKKKVNEDEHFLNKLLHVRLVLKRSPLLISRCLPREYCTQICSNELDEIVKLLLVDLVRFQTRMKVTNPTKAKSKKRYFFGLREVLKLLKRGKIKGIIVAKNIESISAEGIFFFFKKKHKMVIIQSYLGGLNSLTQQILFLCEENEIPVIFSLSRKNLGMIQSNSQLIKFRKKKKKKKKSFQ